MTSQELYDHAVSLLERRDYASGELARALSKMTENRENIYEALLRLVECGYLDDHRLIKHLIDKHVRKKTWPGQNQTGDQAKRVFSGVGRADAGESGCGLVCNGKGSESQ